MFHFVVNIDTGTVMHCKYSMYVAIKEMSLEEYLVVFSTRGIFEACLLNDFHLLIVSIWIIDRRIVLVLFNTSFSLLTFI